ncbi:phosphopantetheine-binding protein [Amycolatopsis sp. PS_44_ISF1]|uniref:phosphopantetheine-binding protein n=1 Tax=Amycolatopsis sp. PS_44_ISF1 TaxID=2974917 RepID=UPI0028DD7B47|nr:phosphopantetheine-binding protein [Amycolatopsis sp. PS_44_ISF1]MDT8913182.1 phosphopantetheine-binding protein [Amycolatopsis sp. PS_44_ISF1]
MNANFTDGEQRRDTPAIPAIQTAVTRIWEEVLRIDGITANDDFFELGGHSLAASQVISRMARDLHVRLTLAEFFEMPTVRELSEFAHSATAPERS